MTGIISRLQKIVNSSSTHDTLQVTIARFLLLNIQNNNLNLSIQDIADGCYTSQASVSRFVRNLGFRDFNELKLSLQEVPSEIDGMLFDYGIHNYKGNQESWVEKRLVTISQSLIDFEKSIDIEAINALCEAIADSENVYFLGTQGPANILNGLQHSFLTIGKYINAYASHHDQISAIKNIEPNSLIIVASMEGSYVVNEVEIIMQLMKTNSKTFLITQNPTMKYANIFDTIISLGKHDEPYVAKYKFMFFCEALLQHYFANYHSQ